MVKKIFKLPALLFLILTGIYTHASGQLNKQVNSNIKFIDPNIGNVAPLLNTNRPVVYLTNQIVPVFSKRQEHLDMQITDFPMLATNIITPQVIFAIKPYIGELTDTGWYRRLTYDNDIEVTQPWYYANTLTDDDIVTEFTAGQKTRIFAPLVLILSRNACKLSRSTSN